MISTFIHQQYPSITFTNKPKEYYTNFIVKMKEY